RGKKPLFVRHHPSLNYIL
ncbi:hypothetical protein D046_7229B, partial [Vibrio parahaemolyticus V-223/04]